MPKSKQITIAVDGFSSCGKSTLARALAKELGYVFIDSGAMYRGIALYCLENALIKSGIVDIEALEESLPDISLEFKVNLEGSQDLYMNDKNCEGDIRTPAVAEVVSIVAAIPTVRKKLVQEQRTMGQTGGIVMDGRDIGSVVFPNAELKLFVTASPDVRAKRRYLELKAKGIETTLEDIKKNLLERDHMDSTRSDSPLIKTKDAFLLDNSHMTREEQLSLALSLAHKKLQEIR